MLCSTCTAVATAYGGHHCLALCKRRTLPSVSVTADHRAVCCAGRHRGGAGRGGEPGAAPPAIPPAMTPLPAPRYLVLSQFHAWKRTPARCSKAAYSHPGAVSAQPCCGCLPRHVLVPQTRPTPSHPRPTPTPAPLSFPPPPAGWRHQARAAGRAPRPSLRLGGAPARAL